MGVTRPPISGRTFRHFNVAFMPEMDIETQSIIIGAILTWGFNDHVNTVQNMIKSLKTICLNVY
jgi:hypothetical protein